MIPGMTPKPLPRWLADLRHCGSALPIPDVLRESLYYPSSGRDGDPVRYLVGLVHSFVYVDYGLERDAVWNSLEDIRHGFRGYRILDRRDVAEHELTPNGWEPSPPKGDDGDPRQYRQYQKQPFAIWSIFARLPEFGDDHGPDRFSLLYVCGDGAATFQALYRGNKCKPLVVAIIQPGTGSGCNWTDFRDPDKIFARSVLGNPYGAPSYLLYGGWGKEYRQCCWPANESPVHYWRIPSADTELGLWKLTGSDEL